MERLVRIVRPDIGIITNIGDAHQENFASLEEKAEEKLKLFAHTPTIIYNKNDEILQRLVPLRYADRRLSADAAAHRDLRGIPYSDTASRENAAEALALFDELGFNSETIRKRLPMLQNVAMRMEIKDGINGCKIVNDS